MISIRIVDLGVAALGLFTVCRLLKHRRALPFPPGPRGLPLIGNILDWPKEYGWISFARWGETYGDILHLNLCGKHIIVLNDPQLAVEMLDRKGAIYSDRPFIFLLCELAGWKHALGLSPPGDRHRRMRSLLSKEIGTRAAVERFTATAQSENVKFLRKMLDNPQPEALPDHLRHMVAAVILRIAYGYHVQENDDPWIFLSERVARDITKSAQTGAHLVDILPVLNILPGWLPGMRFKEEAAEMRAAKALSVSQPYDYVKDQLAAGIAPPSLVANAIDGVEVSPAYESVVQYAAASLYDAGMDTTIAVLYTFFLAMTLYPQLQQRARAEIFSVVGPDRLPTAADRDQLPFIAALHKEVLRWGSIGPLGVAHMAREDDVHTGYFIPKGAIVLPNIWAFTHDASIYCLPDTFDPERFLGESGRAVEADPRAYVFGFGRRVCPGAALANTSTFLTMAMVLATLDISRPRNAAGEEIVPSTEFTSGLISQPKPFVCVIKPQSARADALVRASDGRS